MKKLFSTWSFEHFQVGYQIYLFPTVKITNDLRLSGYRAIEFIWLKRGIEIGWGREA
jgi:hypothetical protein